MKKVLGKCVRRVRRTIKYYISFTEKGKIKNKEITKEKFKALKLPEIKFIK